MILYLIRHGETDQNKKRCLQGQSDIELNAYGRELALKTAEGLKNVNFDFIFTSPLKRAAETAEMIKRDREIPIIKDERIQEISFGVYEGLSFGKDTYNIPDPDFMTFFTKPHEYVVPSGGESFQEVLERTGEFLEALKGDSRYKEKTVLLSTHGCALKALLANIKGTPLPEFWGEGVHKNCAVSVVELADGNYRVLEEGKVYY